MQLLKRLHLLGLLLLLLAMGLVPPAATGAASPTHGLHCGGWSLVKSPNPDSQYDLLNAVTAVSASDVWAVGYGDSPSLGLHTLIEHYDGSAWQVVPSPSAGGSILFGVVAISASNIWAVGYGQDAQQALIEHFDGSQWKIVANPAPSSSAIVLQAVSANSASDVWAVGDYANGSEQETLIEHFDGSQWSVVKSPSFYGAVNLLKGVAALSSTDVWAVGQVEGRQTTPLSMHWNGTKWQRVHVPYHSTPSDLQGVTALSSTDVWAVGQAGGLGYATWHWDGTRWKQVPIPQVQSGLALAVAASSPDNVWSVGWTVEFNAMTEAAHWNGKQWQAVPPRNRPGGTDNNLYGVVMTSAQTVWAVGSSGDYGSGYTLKTLIEYYC